MQKKGFQISSWLVFSELCIILLAGYCIDALSYTFSSNENVLSCLTQLLTFIPVGCGIIFLKKIYKGKSKDLLGFRGFDITMLLFFLILPYFTQSFASIAAAPANYVLSELFGNPNNVGTPENITDFFWLLLSACIIAPITEELLFRGVIFKLLSPFGVITAVVVSSIMFSLLHVSPSGFIIIFAMGVMIGIVRYVSGSVIACMAFHAINNFYSIMQTVFYNHITTVMNSYYIIITLVSAVLFVPVLLLYMKLYPQSESYHKTQAAMGMSVGLILTVLIFAISCFYMLFI